MALLTDRACAGAPSARNRAAGWSVQPVRRLREAYLCALVLLGLSHGVSHAQGVAVAGEYTEYQIKAAFLFNFAKFVDWPADAFADTTTPITIGIFGENPFGGTLEQIIGGQLVKGRSLVLVQYRRVRDIEGCHILFISAAEERTIPEVLDRVRNSSILTVSEVTDFARDGGIVNFVLHENRVRFEVNVDAAERARLMISSKLLKLADIVREGRRG